MVPKLLTVRAELIEELKAQLGMVFPEEIWGSPKGGQKSRRWPDRMR